MGDRYYFESYVPLAYTTPSFPSLSWPLSTDYYVTPYLYYIKDIWKFTLFWTLIIFTGFASITGLTAAIIHGRLRTGAIIMCSYFVFAALEAFASGSIVGLILAVVYNAGNNDTNNLPCYLVNKSVFLGHFQMSTWIPLVWAIVQILIVIMSSYSTNLFLL